MSHTISLYEVLPIEIIEIILLKIKETKHFKTILNSRLVCKQWHLFYPEIDEYDENTNKQVKKHILKEHYFKTYKMPLLNVERIIYFKKYGGYKYIKYNNFGRVISVIKTTSIYNIEKGNLNQTKNNIIKKIYDIKNDICATETKTTNAINLFDLQREDILNGNNVNYYNNHLVYPNNCIIF